MFTNLNLTDMEAGYKAFRREIIQKIRNLRFRWGLRAKAKRLISSIAVAIPFGHKLSASHAEVFALAYATQAWGSAESRSGQGSEREATTALRSYLPELFKRLDVKIFLDAPCGDWNWMQFVNLAGADYVGIDVVPDVIASNRERFARPGVRFTLADLTKDTLPCADLVLCRDCWVHLSFQDIAAMLENFRRSGTTWLLVSNSPHIKKNLNQITGLRWRYLNLQQAPFHFPKAVESRKDHYRDVPFEITLWRIADLPKING
jgi:SAM-dependent methyltransferase